MIILHNDYHLIILGFLNWIFTGVTQLESLIELMTFFKLLISRLFFLVVCYVRWYFFKQVFCWLFSVSCDSSSHIVDLFLWFCNYICFYESLKCSNLSKHTVKIIVHIKVFYWKFDCSKSCWIYSWVQINAYLQDHKVKPFHLLIHIFP